MMCAMTPAAALAKVRKLCSALPDVTERASHSAPAFLVGKKMFAYFLNNHHGDGRLALWCGVPDGMQRALVDSDPDAYFVPPYVGPSGWVGVRLDRSLPWPQIASVLEAAHANKRVTRRARGSRRTT